MTTPLLTIDYTNYRGESALYRIMPTDVEYGHNEYHPEDTWLLSAWVPAKSAHRTFDMRKIHEMWDGDDTTRVPVAQQLKEARAHIAVLEALYRDTVEMTRVERLVAAIEGECDGLAITNEQAESILTFLDLKEPPSNDHSK